MEKYVNYNALLDTLFEQWKESYDETEKVKFCEDGLMLKADKSVNVDKNWEDSQRRIMFLLKDNPHGGNDTRLWLIDKENGEKNRNLKKQFIRRIAKLFYGLRENKSDVRINAEKVNSNIKYVKEAWNTIPFAFIETKKIAGKKDCDSAVLKNYLERDKMFLEKEIDILKPNIIVCCDGENTLFDFITREYFGQPDWPYDSKYPFWDDQKQEEYFKPEVTMRCRLNYYKQKNVVVIDSYHPSARVQDWAFQERVYCPFSAFLKQCDHNF
jgi:hypothetical protein